MKSVFALVLGAITAAVVSCSSDGLKCGAGTREHAGECVVASGGSSFAGAGGSPEAGTAEPWGGAPSAGASVGEAGEGGAAGGADDSTLIAEPLECGSRDITGATVVSEPITRDTTWSGVIYVPESVSVQNEPTLTILPGTKIIMGEGATIEFGPKGSHPKLSALGTAQHPIKFCGETDSAGSWGGLVFRRSAQAASVLRNVLIADGGDTEAGMVLETPISLQGVQIRNSGKNGLNTTGFGEGSTTLVISGSGEVPLQATAVAAVDVPPDSTLTGNGIDAIDVAFAAFDVDARFRNVGIPYRQLADVDSSKVKTHPVVTLDAGVVYYIRHQAVLDFGAATVHALGTSAQPVVFQGLPCAQDASTCLILTAIDDHAVGGRVSLSGGKDDRLEYVELRSLGWLQAQGPLYIPHGALSIASDAPVLADHVKVSKGSGWGIQFSGKGSFADGSKGLDINVQPHFSTFTPDALSLACGFLMTLPKDTKVSGEPRTNVACYGTSALVAFWPAAAGQYIVNGFTVETGGGITLEAGTVLRFKIGTSMKVQAGGNLTAHGTAELPIQFVHDTTSFTTVGLWNGLVLEAGSEAVLDHAIVDMAGTGEGANITALAPFTLSHSTISNSGAWGLAKAASDPTDYLTGNTFTANKAGDVTVLK